LDPGHQDPIEWDVRDKDGNLVAPDVYIYHIIADGNKKNGKIVIVR
jgi:hypothetical protein